MPHLHGKLNFEQGWTDLLDHRDIMPTFMSIVSLALILWSIKRCYDFLTYIGRRLRQAPYPPGPKPKPLIGNLLDFPIINTAQAYVEWGKRYNSKIVHGAAFGNHIVVVNSLEHAEQLFERNERARIYADRPVIPIFKLMGGEWNFSLLRYGDSWRQHRKVCQQNFNFQAAKRYEPLQMSKVQRLLQGLLETPKEFEAHNKMFSISLTMSMMYGYEIKSIEEPCVVVGDDMVELSTQLLVPGGSLINVIPVLRHIPAWVPGASSRKQAAEVRRLTEEMIRIPLDFVKKSFEEGTAVPSLVTDFYEKKYTVGASQEEEEVIKSVAFTVYGGASDTTISSTSTFFYTMAVNPDVQRRAQAEIDRVVGSKRLPTLEDRESLPYIEAIYREVMRFAPPLLFAVPHCVSEDDHYMGYFIPKGTTILPNVWAMTHDEEIYSDPFAFKPERFLDDKGELNGDERILAFGFGRRACVGKYIASSTMWLLIASILACFDIAKAKDENGNEIEINGGYDDNPFVHHKSKFECSIRARSIAAQKLIVDGV